MDKGERMKVAEKDVANKWGRKRTVEIVPKRRWQCSEALGSHSSEGQSMIGKNIAKSLTQTTLQPQRYLLNGSLPIYEYESSAFTVNVGEDAVVVGW